MDLLKIEYSNTHDLIDKVAGDISGRVLYQNGYSNSVYLDVDVKEPKYPILEDGKDNGDKEFIPTFLKWEKRYVFTDYLPEFLVDALTLIPIHNSIWITLKNGESNKVKDVITDVDWEDIGETEKSSGCFAKVTFSFAVDSIILTTCGDDMTIN